MVEMVSLLKVKQGLDLKIWKVDRKPTNQEEALLNLNWDKIDSLILSLPEQKWEQAPELIQTLFHQVFRRNCL